jgi:hypothetical protein
VRGRSAVEDLAELGFEEHDQVHEAPLLPREAAASDIPLNQGRLQIKE